MNQWTTTVNVKPPCMVHTVSTGVGPLMIWSHSRQAKLISPQSFRRSWQDDRLFLVVAERTRSQLHLTIRPRPQGAPGASSDQTDVTYSQKYENSMYSSKAFDMKAEMDLFFRWQTRFLREPDVRRLHRNSWNSKTLASDVHLHQQQYWFLNVYDAAQCVSAWSTPCHPPVTSLILIWLQQKADSWVMCRTKTRSPFIHWQLFSYDDFFVL